MRHSYRTEIPPKPQPYRTQVLDHLGLVAGMFEELSITEVIDHATQQDPEMRMVTAGQAVTAMVLNGLGFVNSEHRQPQAQRTVDHQWRKQRDQAGRAFKTLCRTALACEVDAQQALTRLGAGLQTTFLHDSPIGPTPPDGKRGRPGPGAQPDQIVSPRTGTLASRLTDRQARVDQQSRVILATNALDEAQVSAQARLDGHTGRARAARGCRFRKAPPLFASSLERTKPERMMALLMVMTGCGLVEAAFE